MAVSTMPFDIFLSSMVLVTGCHATIDNLSPGSQISSPVAVPPQFTQQASALKGLDA